MQHQGAFVHQESPQGGPRATSISLGKGIGPSHVRQSFSRQACPKRGPSPLDCVGQPARRHPRSSLPMRCAAGHGITRNDCNFLPCTHLLSIPYSALQEIPTPPALPIARGVRKANTRGGSHGRKRPGKHRIIKALSRFACKGIARGGLAEGCLNEPAGTLIFRFLIHINRSSSLFLLSWRCGILSHQ